MPMKARQMIRLLKKNGFIELPGKGSSHRKFYNPVTKRFTVVPYHSTELKKGIEQAIFKQAGLKGRDKK